MCSIFLNTLSAATQEHIALGRSRRETLCWLVFLITRYGTVCLWRLAAHAPSIAQTDSVRRRFYRFFQFVHIDASTSARMVVCLLGLSGKSWALTIDPLHGSACLHAREWHQLGLWKNADQYFDDCSHLERCWYSARVDVSAKER